jgi:hypothetical protein
MWKGTCSATRETTFTPGMASNGIKTLKAAIEIIPNPLSVSR